jgi:hypothetical protein
MAFVRWRGCCAQLLTTVYENGRSKQIVLARLPEFYASDLTKMRVAEKFPRVKVDWEAVDRALAQGPPSGVLKQDTPSEHLDYAAVEHYLRQWAEEAEKAGLGGDATKLRIAAGVLTKWRNDFYWANQPEQDSRG